MKPPGERSWREEPLQSLGNDRWGGTFTPDRPGRWQFRVAAWSDRVATWQDEIRRKVEAGQEDLAGELSEGAQLLGRDRDVEEALAAEAGDRHGEATLADASRSTSTACSRASARGTSSSRARGAAFAASPRSLPQLAELGFDVVYLPPVHPIGHTNRKGTNNTLTPEPGDVGSPWAIGAEEGGHDAIHPDLGTWDDFDAMVAAAKQAKVELALDFAIQCSPDHPWLKEHPEWFNRRPDGTLKYAENPPKKYQDIYNVNFESEDWQGLWQALLDVVLFWVGRGITVFRVDNPHTKPVPFWEWLIREVRREHPEVIFLAEAFTRPSMMTTLAKIGFAQSYTYFTWKNTKAELAEYMAQLLAWHEFYRPNAFANTPDILHEYLQHGGPPAFEARLVLAATLSPTYGIYSGYESFENVPVRDRLRGVPRLREVRGRPRALDGPLLPLVRRLNEVAARAAGAAARREHPLARDRERAARRRTAKDDSSASSTSTRSPSSEGVVRDPGRARLSARFRRAELLTGDGVHVARGPQLRALGPGKWLISFQGSAPMSDSPGTGSSATPTGSRRPSSTRSTCAGSTTATTTARATSAGSRTSSTTCSGSASTASGCCPSTRARCGTAGTTSPTSSRSIPTTGRSTTSSTSSTRRTSAGCA